jgi:hypothetical protein
MALLKQINKGTGAGGSMTTKNGSKFEKFTSIEPTLEKNNFTKVIFNKKSKDGYYYEYENENTKILYFKQNGLHKYMKDKFDIDIYRKPDEAYLIYDKNKSIYTLKILEKKNQNTEGSVEDKLKTGNFSKREYEKMLISSKQPFNVEYAFVVSKFLHDKLSSNNTKYKNIKEIMVEDNIKLFYGEDENYFTDVMKYIMN